MTLVVLDVRPFLESTGSRCAARLRQGGDKPLQGKAILILPAHDAEPNRAWRTRPSRAYDYVTKPFSLQELEAPREGP